jgi:hypothetical protein
MKLESLHKIDNQLILLFEGDQGVTLAPFGNTVYSTISEGIHKSMLTQYKEDALINKFDLKKLRKLWI